MKKNEEAIAIDIDIPIEDILDMDSIANEVSSRIDDFVIDRFNKCKSLCGVNMPLELEMTFVGDLVEPLPVRCLPNSNLPKNYLAVNIIDDVELHIKQQIADVFNSDKYGKAELQINSFLEESLDKV